MTTETMTDTGLLAAVTAGAATEGSMATVQDTALRDATSSRTVRTAVPADRPIGVDAVIPLGIVPGVLGLSSSVAWRRRLP
jgi:hypothetical protein